jgi:hypothetical protein
MSNPLECIYIAAGTPEAEMIKSFLEASGITVVINQESYGVTMGLTIGALGMVEILVPKHQAKIARDLLKQDYSDLSDDESEPPIEVPED